MRTNRKGKLHYTYITHTEHYDIEWLPLSRVRRHVIPSQQAEHYLETAEMSRGTLNNYNSHRSSHQTLSQSQISRPPSRPPSEL
ncbi:hypothetical protein BgiBS90_025442, partial [Biomphalaria glabrata]